MTKRMIVVAVVLALIVIGVLLTRAVPQQAVPTPVSELQEAGQKKEVEDKKPSEQSTQKNRMQHVTLETSKGTIVVETYDADAPRAVANFTKLAKEGFYDGLMFHRVIKGFMIQGGDPAGNGTGGPGYTFEDELNPETASYKQGYKKGVVAMANAGPNTNGSQFFIMLEDYPLPNAYTIFGKVIQGQDVVDAIGEVKTVSSDKPAEDVKIKKATVSATQ